MVLLKTELTWIPFLASHPHLTRFIAHLFVGCPYFCLRNSVGLVIDLSIDNTLLIIGEVANSLSKWSLWNNLMSFLRCCTAEAGFQVFSSSRYLFQKTRSLKLSRWSDFDSLAYSALSQIASTLYSLLLLPASNSICLTFSSTRFFLVVSCSNSDTWKTLWIF